MAKTSTNKERLQKLLANAGLGSRREIERWIENGEVMLNSKLAQLGDKASLEDEITVRGKPVGKKRLSDRLHRVIVYNKPEGELVTRNDPEGRPTIFPRLPKLPSGRWIPVGRLDINSSGLLLLTTDGELANKLMHPSSQVDREYAVRVRGQVTDEQIVELVNGVELEDGPARFEDVVDIGGNEGSNRWFHVVIMEGRKREVRRMWEAVGALVSRLIRVRYGPIALGSRTTTGRWRELDKDDIKKLYGVAGFKRVPPLATIPLRKKYSHAGKKPGKRGDGFSRDEYTGKPGKKNIWRKSR